MSNAPTEPPSPRKLRRARQRGEVARSPYPGAAAVLLTATAILATTRESLADRFAATWAAVMQTIERGSPSPAHLLTTLSRSWAEALVPLFVACVGAAVVGSLLQVGMVFSLTPVVPDARRVNPAAGLSRLFDAARFADLLKAIGVMGIVGWLGALALGEAARSAAGLVDASVGAALAGTGRLVEDFLWRVGLVLGAVAGLDWCFQRWRHHRRLRMTRQEVRQENREEEGDPHLKQRRLRLHQELLTYGLLEEVRSSDVLVTNPIRLAVALRYDQTSQQKAPQVTARGQEELARRMIRAAEGAGVPVVQDVPLARVLYELETGDEIPPELYEVVAAILRAAWAERETTDGV